MKDKSLAERLIYLDTDFVTRLYEAEFDVSPKTLITRTQAIQASASIALFSGGGSSSESKSYSLSTLEMLDQLTKRLAKYPDFEHDQEMDTPSKYVWVDGTLGISKVKVTRTSHTITLIGEPDPTKPRNAEEFVGEEAFFALKSGDTKFALSPTDEYFVPGVASFKGLSHLVIDRLSLPCRALLRVFSANTSFGEWIATPLVIYDPAGC
ncbi:hypothetical protein HDE76_001270 [Rhodanobacter sp. ANJX3]|uniref:hypothetical protein n=1 Tax=Rhodanobacter sp. ANJX3 TaxID=2723083 RepID=UPI001610FDBC|nr:hypothetical protein [Rhodanobacter sp. ANJX3]MBB5358064.1 hypothetical protein [Rhodanobacter sp. ANJX3]